MAPSWTSIDKLFAFFTATLLSASTFYFFTNQFGDPLRCHALLNDGLWLDSDLNSWQPAGCMHRQYKSVEFQNCLRDQRIVFIGGNNTRRLFELTLSNAGLQHERSPDLAYTANENVLAATTDFEFFWDTSLNGTELRRFRLNAGFDDDRKPRLVVVGLDNEFVRKQTDPKILDLEMETLIAAFGSTLSEQSRRAQNVAFLPASRPNTSALEGWDKTALAAGKVDAINDALYRNAIDYAANTAFAFSRILRVPGMLHGNGLQPSEKAETLMLDILYNFACNRGLPKQYPYASTCCNEYPAMLWPQVATFVLVLFLIPIALYFWCRGYDIDDSWFLGLMPGKKYLWPLFTMGMAVLLCFICDRTNIFEKAHKQTGPAQFFILMTLIFLVSLYTLKSSEKDLPFLNRDQTDEWKGWMQVAILVYHYVGVSKTQYIYNYMRVCPTSYLFMTGFGHTVYFLKKGDFSFKRVASTMLRLNLLNAMLAYTLDTDWLFYYFAPLVTWNFFVVYFTLYAFHKSNSSLKFLLCKIVAFQALNLAIYNVPGVLDGIWWLLQTTLRMQGDLREWRFRITLDQFAVVPGMLAAILFLRWDEIGLARLPRFLVFKRVAVAVAAAVMILYVLFEVRMPSKQVYNMWHPYTAWLPCVSFVILRNATARLRRTHNTLFAWFGRGSLETFLLQFHIWLAADTAGLLVIPGLWWARGLNAALTTIFFLWIAAKVTDATGDVIAWIMAVDGVSARQDGVQIELQEAGDKSLIDPSLVSKKRSVKDVVLDALQSNAKVRIGVLLSLMVAINWTYYF